MLPSTRRLVHNDLIPLSTACTLETCWKRHINLTLEQVLLVYRREEVLRFARGELSNFYQGRIKRGPAAQVGQPL